MARIQGITVPIEGDAGDLKRELAEASRETTRFSRQADSDLQVLATKFSTLGIAGAAALGAIGAQGVQAAAELGNLARNANVSVESFQQLSRAARRFGADGSDLVGILTRSAEVVDEARLGTAQYVEDLEALGLTYESLRNLAPEAQLQAIADGLLTLENDAQRTATGIRLLGDDITRLGGAEGIRQIGALADEVDRVFTEQQVQEAQALVGNIGDLWDQIRVGVAGPFLDVTARLRELASEVETFPTQIGALQASEEAGGIDTSRLEASYAAAVAQFESDVFGARPPTGVPDLSGELDQRANDLGDQIYTLENAFNSLNQPANDFGEAIRNMTNRVSEFVDRGPIGTGVQPAPLLDPNDPNTADARASIDFRADAVNAAEGFAQSFGFSLTNAIATGNYDSLEDAARQAFVGAVLGGIVEAGAEQFGQLVGGFFSRQDGGFIEGDYPGQPRFGVAHVGELVLNVAQQRNVASALLDGGSGGPNINFNLADVSEETQRQIFRMIPRIAIAVEAQRREARLAA